MQKRLRIFEFFQGLNGQTGGRGLRLFRPFRDLVLEDLQGPGPEGP